MMKYKNIFNITDELQISIENHINGKTREEKSLCLHGDGLK